MIGLPPFVLNVAAETPLSIYVQTAFVRLTGNMLIAQVVAELYISTVPTVKKEPLSRINASTVAKVY